MPKLINKASKRPFSITAKLTADEYKQISVAADRLKITPSALSRQALLAATTCSHTERLIIAKTCKVEAMVQLLFGALFAQLNDNSRFEKEHFRQALETAETLQFRKADEHISRYSTLGLGAKQDA